MFLSYLTISKTSSCMQRMTRSRLATRNAQNPFYAGSLVFHIETAVPRLSAARRNFQVSIGNVLAAV